MKNFFPNQRWTSEGEPELGVGIVMETSKNRVQIEFPFAGETRLYSLTNAPLRRVVFKTGDKIVDTQKETLTIEKVEKENELFIYYGQGRSISEANLGDVSVKHGVDDRLCMGDVDSPELFILRRKTLNYDYKRKISPINGFIGGRVDLIPHQLYIAHEVSSRYAPRVLLSDQVGLGKTIEACLILHRLLLSGRISRVLILVPDSLIHQWFVEILRRFNMWFHIFDEERCASLEESAPDGNPFLDNQLIICSTSFLAKSKKRTQQALAASWDMLVVDEAHHLEWSVEKTSPEYSIVELLSRDAKGLLLLTATPDQLGQESHFARLRLLDPDRYSDYETFKNETQDHKAIANIVENISADKELKASDKKLLESIFSKERIDSFTKGHDSDKNDLIEDLLDQHGPGRVIFRNTRSAMSGFPKRKPHMAPIETKNPKLWIERLSKEFLVDINTSTETANEQEFWFANDPRVSWLIKTMKELNSKKVLLICKSREKVLALEKTLSKRVNFKVGVFHEELTIVQRDRNAAWFSEPDGARLLLCSEIGSEGRNFQFAHHLILFDLPFQPELLEQRIGRLDRIGQTEDIHIHVPYVVGSPQEVLVRWYNEGLNAFKENLEGGNKIAKQFEKALLNTCLTVSSPEFEKQLNNLLSETVIYQTELKKILANGRNRLLEMNSFRPRKAEKLIDQIRTEDQDMSLEKYMACVFELFSVEMEDLANRSYLLRQAKTDIERFPSIPDAGISITFDRKRALSREDVSFISWDHPMTTGAIDMVLSSGTGGASFGVLRNGNSPGILLEVLFVLETAGDQRGYVDRFLPSTPIRVVVDHTGNEVTEEYSTETIDKHITPGQINDLIDNEAFVDTMLPNMISTATEIAEVLKNAEISGGLNRMLQTINHEINRLKALHKKNNHIRIDEVKTALEEQIKLATLIESARIRLDSILLIRKGEF